MDTQRERFDKSPLLRYQRQITACDGQHASENERKGSNIESAPNETEFETTAYRIIVEANKKPGNVIVFIHTTKQAHMCTQSQLSKISKRAIDSRNKTQTNKTTQKPKEKKNHADIKFVFTS